MPVSEKFELRKLVLSNDACPFDEWFEALSIDDQYMVDNRLHRVRQGSLGEINVVGEGVWEFKFRKGRALRIYYSQVGKVILLLLMGGDKATQNRDINKAKELLAAYKAGEVSDANH